MTATERVKLAAPQRERSERPTSESIMPTLVSNAYPRGSEWRRWDLHVHTPHSYLTPSFSGITFDRYVADLEAASVAENIAVLGVTDYLSIEGYKELYHRKRDVKNPVLQSVSLLIPNIEFRVGLQTNRGNSLNIHLLIDPTTDVHIEEIERALSRLSFSFGSKHEKFGCTSSELERFGKVLDSKLTGEAALRHGTKQYKPSWEEFYSWLDDSAWLKANSLVGISGGEDGIGGLGNDSGMDALKQQLVRRSHFIFSGNPSNRSYFLGKKDGFPVEEMFRLYGGLKACLHGSDAHSVDKLFKPDGDRRCFVRADPTFEGLRQVTLEPESRVSIASDPPAKPDQSRVIDRIQITNDQGWFNDLDLELNDGVVAVIGEKGSGKTALAELIAFAAGTATKVGSTTSFLYKARQLLKGTRVELTWCSGEKTAGTLVDKPADVAAPLVRYLSQDFVEQLCSTEITAAALQAEIETVVFSKLDPMTREGHSTFSDLQRSRQDASERRRDEIKGKISTNIRETVRLNEQITGLPEKKKVREQTVEHIDELKKQIPAATEGIDDALVTKLEESRTKLNEVQDLINVRTHSQRLIQNELSEYRRIKKSASDDILGVARRLIEADSGLHGLIPSLEQDLQPLWNDSIEAAIEQRSNVILDEVQALTGSEERLAPDGRSLFQIQVIIVETEAKIQSGEAIKNRLIALQHSVATQEALQKGQEAEIERLQSQGPKQLEELRLERLKLFESFLDELFTERDSLSQLYEPMAARLEELSKEGAKMRFALSAAVEVNREEWLNRFVSLTDSRKSSTSARREEVNAFVNGDFDAAITGGDRTQIVESVAKLEQISQIDSIQAELGNPSSTSELFYDWLFSASQYAVTYQINYDDTKLRFLSPGTRGIALLVLYILMDDQDTRPLIVDQPEGNLDSSSVYGQLVPYIRSARRSRQIILVTHNPNLVVGTDADQIVVVTADRSEGLSHPKLGYQSGALEQTGIEGQLDVREAACSILEGGREAFLERENRYSLDRT